MLVLVGEYIKQCFSLSTVEALDGCTRLNAHKRSTRPDTLRESQLSCFHREHRKLHGFATGTRIRPFACVGTHPRRGRRKSATVAPSNRSDQFGATCLYDG